MLIQYQLEQQLSVFSDYIIAFLPIYSAKVELSINIFLEVLLYHVNE